MKKSIINPETSFILIDSKNCFRVDLSTTTSKEIRVEALLDGEYKDDLLVKIEENGPTIEISTGFQPNFIKPNDKLSAHKVISISLKIQIPENMKAYLFGSNTNVYVEGNYMGLKVTLDDGNCSLDQIKGNTTAVTRSGDIHVQAKEATIETKNSFGNIESEKIPLGNDYYNLTTTTGNIYLIKTE